MSGQRQKICRSMSQLFGRIADGEATPQEALCAARHLSDCTSCRIILARERRLAAFLERGMSDPLQVDESFVDEIMARLPQGPPPPPKRKSKRHRLRLASYAGLLALFAWPTLDSTIVGRFGNSAWSLVPRLAAPDADGFAEGSAHIGGLVLLAMDRFATGMAIENHAAHLALLAVGAALISLSAGMAATVGALWLWLSSGGNSGSRQLT